MTDKNFGNFGNQFQQALLKSIIEDKKYGEQIIEVIDVKYFDNNSFRYIIQNIKELYQKYNKIPNYDDVSYKIKNDDASGERSTIHIDSLEQIRELEASVYTPTYVKDTSLNFCKMQNLKKTLKNVNAMIEKDSEFEAYDRIEEMIKDSLQVGTTDDDFIDIADISNISEILSKDSRVPIPTGITGLDNILKGGLGHGELGMILAPTGIGKSTILTIFASAAAQAGKNVVQIFFEDTKANIIKKHYTIWTGLDSDEQLENVEETTRLVEHAINNLPGKLHIIKMESDRTTMGEIKRKLRKLEATEGWKADLVIVDYIDCIINEKSTFGEEWKGEGQIIRSMESMCSEHNVAIWTATQGNRNSISSELVTSDQMGGSIKKAQSAHVIISIARSLEQKEAKLANLTLVKSRIGKDGINFNNCKFDNQYLKVDVSTTETLLGHQKSKEIRNQNRASELYLRKTNPQINITNQTNNQENNQ